MKIEHCTKIQYQEVLRTLYDFIVLYPTYLKGKLMPIIYLIRE